MARFSFFQSFQYLLLLNIKYSTSLPFIVIIQFNNALLIILCRKKILKINLYIILLYTKIYIYMYISILETNCYTIYIIFASFNFSIKKERGKKEIPRPERLHLLYPRHLIFLYRTKKISKINLNPRTVGYIHSSSSPLQHPRHLIFSHSPMKRKNSKDQSLKKNYSHPVHLIFPSRYAKKKKKRSKRKIPKINPREMLKAGSSPSLSKHPFVPP